MFSLDGHGRFELRFQEMATRRCKLSPLAQEVLAEVREHGFVYTSRYDHRGPAWSAKMKRVADRLARCGLAQVGMDVPYRGVWVIERRRETST